MRIYTEVVIDMNPDSSTYGEHLSEESHEYNGDMALCFGGGSPSQMNMSTVQSYFDPASDVAAWITGPFSDMYMDQINELGNFAETMQSYTPWLFESGESLFNQAGMFWDDAQEQVAEYQDMVPGLLEQAYQTGDTMMTQGQDFIQQGYNMMDQTSDQNQQYRNYLADTAANVASQTANQQSALFAQGGINPALANAQTEITNYNAGRGVNESFMNYMNSQQALGLQSQQLGAQQYGAGATHQAGTISDAMGHMGNSISLLNQAAGVGFQGQQAGIQGYQAGMQGLGQVGGMYQSMLQGMGQLGQLNLGAGNTYASIAENYTDAYAANIQMQNEYQAGQMGFMGGLLQAGIGAWGMAALSDMTLKENIELVDISDNGINIYEFEYIDKIYGDGRYRGVMAQEVPEASLVMPNGHLAVDYSKVDVNFERIV